RDFDLLHEAVMEDHPIETVARIASSSTRCSQAGLFDLDVAPRTRWIELPTKVASGSADLANATNGGNW
ncbi:MAG TPA: hypothetical protein VGQ34_05200, partial [Sphingomicrobium sp.]|nr:hypothetical protein [Sphingomicrobium sp.]